MKFKTLTSLVVVAAGGLANNVLAATSTINNNVRILEDTLWIFPFTLMIVAGLLMQRLSAGLTQLGYKILILAGVTGWLWKCIGLLKRVFIVKEPRWLFDVARETLEGLSGLVLSAALLVLVYSLIRVFDTRD